MTIHYYILDSETSGTKSGYHEIFQLSILRCSDEAQITHNICVENPDRATYESLKITNTKREDLSRGESLIDVVEKIHEFLDEDESTAAGRCIVAHNAAFDRRFCHADWERVKKRFPADLWMCTMAFTKKYAKREGLEKIASIQGLPKARFSLEMSLKALGITPEPGAHSANVDVVNTKKAWDKLMNEKLGHVPLIKNLPHKFMPLDEFDISDYQ